jgi:hypothetical protein
MLVVVLVVVNNFLFGIACLWIARRIWKFRLKLAKISDQILGIERAVHRVLYPAPGYITKAQMSTSKARDRYAKLGVQYEKIQQILSILSLAQLFLRYGRVLVPKSRPAPPVGKR